MRRYLSSILIVLVSTLGGGLLTAGQASQRHIEKGVVEFNDPVRLLGVTLRGRYLFLHHDGLMQRGKPCTYVYALSDANPGSLILSFHCIPVPAEKVARLTFRFSGTSRGFDVPEILEIQFANSAESHKVR